MAGKQVAVNFHQLETPITRYFRLPKKMVRSYVFQVVGKSKKGWLAEFRVIDGLFIDAKKSSGKEMEGNGETLGIGKPFGDW